ncbi:MAG TPA: helix-turn-helix transcriptional regulator [Methylibium sp.]|uniref:helix-turn-helix domain-containing protein n=1 Tax=Methylibium sp. TaxID=2067992 RepID=UPI002DBF693E|nr:helix-turn-helix transcriptional regulator [Methylibium sp.]HEU4458506.1 helix-turn-helix transcriptional regulator [Methylibium sp.]
MSSSLDLITALKAELKAAQLTYADLADALGMSESSIKRMFAKADMPLSRIDDVLRVLKLDFADLARRIAEAQPLREELTLEQERAVVADRKLLLMAICVLSLWSVEQIVATYRIEPAECEAYLKVLDRLGIVEQRDATRYRLKLAKTFRWRPDGPVMGFFRAQVVDDYFAGGFDGANETLMLVHGQVAPAAARGFVERLQRIGQDLAQQHLADQRLDAGERQPVTLLVGLRAWWFAALLELRR